MELLPKMPDGSPFNNDVFMFQLFNPLLHSSAKYGTDSRKLV